MIQNVQFVQSVPIAGGEFNREGQGIPCERARSRCTPPDSPAIHAQFGFILGRESDTRSINLPFVLCEIDSTAIVFGAQTVHKTFITFNLEIASVSHFSPRQAAQALGVSESSIKRWCDLGAVPVLRTAGGHRRIPRKSLEDLLAQGGDLGSLLKLSDAASSDVAAKEGCGDSDKTDPPASESAKNSDAGDRKLDVFAGDDLLEVQTEFRDALRIGLESRCRQLVDDLLKAGFSRSSAADFLMTKAMHQFGHMWEHGDLAVYQERRACGICMGLLHELKRSFSLAPGAPVAIGGTPRGDIYQLPTQMIELALCEAGWNATSLGCNLPIASFAEAVREYEPSLLWISLSSIEAEESFVREFNELADLLSKGTALIIGGRAANDSLRPRLRYTAHCDSLVHLSELAAKFLKRP